MAALPGALLAACTVSSAVSSPTPVTAPARSTPLGTSESRSSPVASSWWLRKEQTAAQSAAGTFALKAVEIINLDLHAYYALRSPTPGPPQATAQSTFASCQPAASGAQVGAAAVQSFGPLDDIDVGVIHVPIVDQPGQVVSLAITPPDAPSPAWTLTFLEQLAPIAHAQGLEGYSIDPAASLPEIQVETLFGYQVTRNSGYFAVAQPGSPTSYLPSTFFVGNRDGTITQITGEEFTTGTFMAVAPVKAYVPQPTYRPTASPVGALVQTPTPPRVQC